MQCTHWFSNQKEIFFKKEIQIKDIISRTYNNLKLLHSWLQLWRLTSHCACIIDEIPKSGNKGLKCEPDILTKVYRNGMVKIIALWMIPSN